MIGLEARNEEAIDMALLHWRDYPPPAMPAAPEGKKSENKKLFGTGFFVSSEGHIITNSHIVKDCSAA